MPRLSCTPSWRTRPPTRVKANIIARVEPLAAPDKGDLIHLHVKEGSMLFFDAESGDRIASR